MSCDRRGTGRRPPGRPPEAGGAGLQKQVRFHCVSLIAVLFDQRACLFIIYVFSRCKRLMHPIRNSSV